MAALNTKQIAEFGNYFKDHLNDYVIVGGAATLLYLDERAPGKHSKATKDLDIIVLDLNPDGRQSSFIKKFTTYIKELNYTASKGQSGDVRAYRFVNPSNSLAPAKIEIATRASDIIRLSSVLIDNDKLTVSDELYAPLEKFFMMKSQSLDSERVRNLRGQGMDADKIIVDIQQYILKAS